MAKLTISLPLSYIKKLHEVAENLRQGDGQNRSSEKTIAAWIIMKSFDKREEIDVRRRE